MKQSSIRLFCMFAVIIAAGSASGKDTIVIRNQTHQGIFEGYENGNFIFRTSGGETLRETRSMVRELSLDPPRNADVTMSRGRTSETRKVQGYRAMRFVFMEGEKEQTDFATAIDEIRMQRPATAAAGAGAPSSGPAAIPAINLAGVEDNPDLTPEQRSAVDTYKQARTRYDEFLAESSALVSEMDRSQGRRRDELLNILRRRRDEEMPIRNALQEATNRLLAAFPQSD